MTVGTVGEYEAALRRMLPRGAYWDNLLSATDGDLRNVLAVKAEWIVRFRRRMADLLLEAYPISTSELIASWERVYLEVINDDKPLEERRAAVEARRAQVVSVSNSSAYRVAECYGASIRIEFPYRVGCFGFATFGQTRIGSQAVLSVIFIFVSGAENIADRNSFESDVTAALLANHVPFFFYDS